MGVIIGKINNNSIIEHIVLPSFCINTNKILFQIYNDNVTSYNQNNSIIRLTIYNSENYKKVIFHDNKAIK